MDKRLHSILFKPKIKILSCIPVESVRNITRQIDYSTKAVYDNIDKFEKLGLITVDRSGFMNKMELTEKGGKLKRFYLKICKLLEGTDE